MKTALKYLSAAVFFFLSTICINVCHATVSEAEFLSNVAKQYMLAQFDTTQSDKRYLVTPGKVDPKKNYGGKCSGFLTAKLQSEEIKRNNIVIITCSKKENPYTVNVPVSVIVQRAVTVARNNIPKGSLISSDMLETAYINESANMSGLVTDTSVLKGSKNLKDIKAGEPLKMADFCMIAKGDMVIIEAKSPTLSIKTAGVAMQDGKLNSSIQVRNSKTKKIIEAVVAGPGLVRVVF